MGPDTCSSPMASTTNRPAGAAAVWHGALSSDTMPSRLCRDPSLASPLGPISCCIGRVQVKGPHFPDCPVRGIGAPSLFCRPLIEAADRRRPQPVKTRLQRVPYNASPWSCRRLTRRGRGRVSEMHLSGARASRRGLDRTCAATPQRLPVLVLPHIRPRGAVEGSPALPLSPGFFPPQNAIRNESA